MARRRRVLLGMGALVFGSGAMSVNAAFQNGVNPTGDMRIVAEEGLIVEPGIMFRDGSQASDPVDPPNAGSPSGTGPNGTNLYDYTSTNLFGGTGNNGLSGINASDVPAAAIDDETNGSITLQVATKTETDGQIGNVSEGVLQVRNETVDDEDIAIRYSTFGADVGDPSSGDVVSEANVADIFQFKDGANDNRISPDNNNSGTQSGGWELTDPQDVDNVVTVPSGNAVQIYLDYDTNVGSGQIDDAIDTSGSGFSGGTDTVQLVEELAVGIENNSNDIS